jgi:hypothetical protein
MRSIVHFDFDAVVAFAERNKASVSFVPQGDRWNLFVNNEFVLESVQRQAGRATLRWDGLRRLLDRCSADLSLRIEGGLVQFTIPSKIADEPYKSLIYTNSTPEILQYLEEDPFQKVLARTRATV